MNGLAQGLVHLPTFLVAATAVIVVPGPATMLVAGRATSSRQAALATTAGILVGDVLAITLAGAGLSSVAARFPGFMHALRGAGAAWLAWLGIKLLRANAGEPGGNSPIDLPPWKSFAEALAMTLTNPKPMLFFAAFFPLFVQPDTDAPLRAFWHLGVLFEALNILWFAGVVMLSRIVARSGAASNASVTRLGGLALLGCSALVIFA